MDNQLSVAEEYKDVIDDFHKLYWEAHHQPWARAKWLGVPIHKFATDILVMQEIIYDNRPDVIIETGTLHSGSAIFFASICQLIGNGKVISIDSKLREDVEQVPYPRVTYLTGDSTDPAIRDAAVSLIPDGASVMVNLDSLHTKEHVLKELDLWAELVTPGQYLIVEDTNTGDPVLPGWGPGPKEALDTWMMSSQTSKRFVVDKSKEREFLTSNPGGYLRAA